MPHMQVLIAPATGPTTKPKALNCALPFARGSFVAVFDAEDRPDPGQLRAALDAFRSHDDDVACAQASLCIHNFEESWLSQMFAAEYAGQFDVFLPGLAAMRMPLPLGGSSNHFRTSILREVGGWDAWNVTEDADLGFRLARFGYRSVPFD
jgi:cellulose synthase/poly-beta-1,6-N-acetylglucosamine synthase-like glycosyltransferase